MIRMIEITFIGFVREYQCVVKHSCGLFSSIFFQDFEFGGVNRVSEGGGQHLVDNFY